jgi:Domain of unknown function (DUF1772)
MWTDLLTAVSTVGSGIQSGALLMVLLGVCPTLRALSVAEWMPLHVALDRSIERYMPALNITTGVATLALLFMPQPASARLLRVLALTGNVALALMSELVNVRINKFVAARLRTPAAEGAGIRVAERDLIGLRDRWIDWHVWRTVTIAASFILSVSATLLVHHG